MSLARPAHEARASVRTGGAAPGQPGAATLALPRLLQRLARFFANGAWWWAGMGAALLLSTWNPTGIERLDLLAYDLALPQAAPSDRAPVVLAIDDASLARLGNWPWPRALHARMIDRLTAAQAAGVGVAVLFSDPDPRDPAGDAALAAAVARSGRVVLAAAPWPQDGQGLALSPLLPALAALPGGPPLGHVDVEVDLDGQTRSQYLHAGPGWPVLPALALAVYQRAQGVAPAVGIPAPPAAAGAWVRSQEVFPPRMDGVAVHSFADALQAPDLAALVQGRSVFIGVTATGLGHVLASPLAPAHAQLPSILFHAQTFDALQARRLIRPAATWAPLLLALAMVTALALVPRRDRPRAMSTRVLLGGATLALPLAISAALVHGAGVWLPPALAMVALALALAFREAGKLRLVNQRLQRSRQHAQATLQAIEDAVITIDAQRRTVRFANRTAQRQADQSLLEGATLQDAYPLVRDSEERLRHALDACIAESRSIHLPDVLQLQAPDGPRSLRATVSPLHHPDGRVDGAVLVFTDVTSTLAAVREREHAATHDALTGLPNRLLLQERLRRTLSRVRRQGGAAALLFVDLDRFKHVNDSLGHHTGDEVLKVLAQRLRALCRDTDTVARWGGDEFVLILEDVTGAEGAGVAAAKIVEALSQDIALGPEFNHRRLPSAASVGVVLMPRDGHQIEDLLSKADMAMYRAKALPKASYHFWASDMDSRLHDRLALEVELRQALQRDQFVLHYQPQFDLQDGRLVGLEALIRWQRSPDDLVPPGHFIQVAEESGLIIDIGAWAVREVARQIAAWLREGRHPVPVAVNVSGRQCISSDFVHVVGNALRSAGIPARLLRLEITESTAMAEGSQVIGLLREIRALGVEMSLDDFGTGYSSLAYLKHFPIDELKIDRSFVHALPHARDDVAIVQATIALARGLDLRVVAEGVETEEQHRFLRSLHCDMAQGYLLGRPQPAGAVAGLLA